MFGRGFVAEGHAGGDAQDLLAGGLEVVGESEEGLDAGDVVLVEHLADGGRGDAGMDADGLLGEACRLEMVLQPLGQGLHCHPPFSV